MLLTETLLQRLSVGRPEHGPLPPVPIVALARVSTIRSIFTVSRGSRKEFPEDQERKGHN